MTDQRDETTLNDPVGMGVDPDTLGAPEQVPMDDAAGGPQADKSETLDPDETTDEDEVAAKLGDFA